MSKMPLDWHRQCIENQRRHMAALVRRCEEAQANLDRCSLNCARYADQIAEAERRGLDSFDSERFKVRRK